MNKKTGMIALCVGVVLMLLGSVLPFVDASDLVKDAKANLMGGAVILWMVFGVLAIVFAYLGKGVLALLFGILASGGMFISFFANQLGAMFGKGIGYWLVLLSAIFMFVAAIIAFRGCKNSVNGGNPAQ